MPENLRTIDYQRAGIEDVYLLLSHFSFASFVTFEGLTDRDQLGRSGGPERLDIIRLVVVNPAKSLHSESALGNFVCDQARNRRRRRKVLIQVGTNGVVDIQTRQADRGP